MLRGREVGVVVGQRLGGEALERESGVGGVGGLCMFGGILLG